MGWKNRDVVSILDLSKHDVLSLFDLAKEIKKGKEVRSKKTVALLFFEPSTRTYYSFYAAAMKLGCKVLGMQNPKATSLKKGESLIDTVRMFLGYGADAIVMRHPKAGAPIYLAENIDVPVINAGDDSREHPTQALLDVFTIMEKFGKIDGLRIGIMGDLRYGRTPSSLAYLLSKWDTELVFIAPDMLQIDKRNDSMESILKEIGAKYEKTSKLDISKLDVLYVTRIQKERFPDEAEYNKVKDLYKVTPEVLKDAKGGLIIMHPLPRVNELSPELDKTEHAWYFRQAENGLYVRTALLKLVLGD